MKGTLLDSPLDNTEMLPAKVDAEVEKPRRMSRRPAVVKGVQDLKQLFDTYFKPVQSRQRSVGRPLGRIETEV